MSPRRTLEDGKGSGDWQKPKDVEHERTEQA